MTDSRDEQVNPYAPVGTIEQPVLDATGTTFNLVKEFRSQIVSLGVLWIIFGSLAMLPFGFLISGTLGYIDVYQNPMMLTFVLGLGVVAFGWLISGILAVKKNLTGVYLGMGLSYLLLIPNLIQMSLCGIIILIVILMQAHRVVGFARQMRKQGIPLTRRP